MNFARTCIEHGLRADKCRANYLHHFKNGLQLPEFFSNRASVDKDFIHKDSDKSKLYFHDFAQVASSPQAGCVYMVDSVLFLMLWLCTDWPQSAIDDVPGGGTAVLDEEEASVNDYNKRQLESATMQNLELAKAGKPQSVVPKRLISQREKKTFNASILKVLLKVPTQYGPISALQPMLAHWNSLSRTAHLKSMAKLPMDQRVTWVDMDMAQLKSHLGSALFVLHFPRAICTPVYGKMTSNVQTLTMLACLYAFRNVGALEYFPLSNESIPGPIFKTIHSNSTVCGFTWGGEAIGDPDEDKLATRTKELQSKAAVKEFMERVDHDTLNVEGMDKYKVEQIHCIRKCCRLDEHIQDVCINHAATHEFASIDAAHESGAVYAAVVYDIHGPMYNRFQEMHSSWKEWQLTRYEQFRKVPAFYVGWVSTTVADQHRVKEQACKDAKRNTQQLRLIGGGRRQGGTCDCEDFCPACVQLYRVSFLQRHTHIVRLVCCATQVYSSAHATPPSYHLRSSSA